MAKMMTLTLLLAVTCVCGMADMTWARKPAPPPSRWNATYQFDMSKVPAGVLLKNDKGFWTVENPTPHPLAFNLIYSDKELVGGAKVVNGLAFFYFPSGIPQEGKQHLKGWQNLSKEVTTWRITDFPSAAHGFDGQDKVFTRATPVPDPEPFTLKVLYKDRPYQLSGTIVYSYNPAYDTHHKLQVPK